MKYLPWILLALVILALGSSVASLMCPTCWPQDLEKPDRINLAQYFAGLGEIFAVVLAAFEFVRAQRQPRLLVWLEQDGASKPAPVLRQERRSVRQRLSRSVITFSPLRLQPSRMEIRGALITGATAPRSIYDLLLQIDNTGQAPARLVEIHLELKNAPQGTICKRKTDGDSLDKMWDRPSTSQTGSLEIHFRGSSDFIVYPHRRCDASPQEWQRVLGEFHLEIPEDCQSEPCLFLTVHEESGFHNSWEYKLSTSKKEGAGAGSDR